MGSPDRGDSDAFAPACCRYSFIDPRRMKGWVDLGGWLYQDGLRIDGHHPSINRARRRVTMLIETNALPLSQATTMSSGHAAPRHHFSMVPVPSALLYYLVLQYPNYRRSSARYCPMLTHSNEHLSDCIVFGLKLQSSACPLSFAAKLHTF